MHSSSKVEPVTINTRNRNRLAKEVIINIYGNHVDTNNDKITWTKICKMMWTRKNVTMPIVDFPEKPSVHWEYRNPKKPLSMLPVMPRMEKLHVILRGQIKQECNYGPDQNVRHKRKWAKKKEKDKNVDHSQTAAVSKVIIQRGHKVDCPAYICVKETFVLDDYSEVADD